MAVKDALRESVLEVRLDTGKNIAYHLFPYIAFSYQYFNLYYVT